MKLYMSRRANLVWPTCQPQRGSERDLEKVSDQGTHKRPIKEEKKVVLLRPTGN